MYVVSFIVYKKIVLEYLGVFWYKKDNVFVLSLVFFRGIRVSVFFS